MKSNKPLSAWVGVAAVLVSLTLTFGVLLLALGVGPGKFGFDVALENATSKSLVFKERLDTETYFALSDGTLPARATQWVGVFRHCRTGPGKHYWIGFFANETSPHPFAEIGLTEKEMRSLDGEITKLEVQPEGLSAAVRLVPITEPLRNGISRH